MSFLKNITKVASELAVLQKYYHSHLWITEPAQDGLCYVGVSDFAKRYIVRFNKLNMEGYTKTHYGINNRFFIEAFIQETKERKQRGELKISEQIEWERFHIRQDEPFVTLETTEFDIQLLAPVDMRVVGYEFNTEWSFLLLTAPYFFQVHPLAPLQLTSLLTEQQYLRSRKMFKLDP